MRAKACTSSAVHCCARRKPVPHRGNWITSANPQAVTIPVPARRCLSGGIFRLIAHGRGCAASRSGEWERRCSEGHRIRIHAALAIRQEWRISPQWGWKDKAKAVPTRCEDRGVTRRGVRATGSARLDQRSAVAAPSAPFPGQPATVRPLQPPVRCATVTARRIGTATPEDAR